MSIERLLKGIPGFVILNDVEPVIPRTSLPEPAYRDWLRKDNGAIAFEGCLRFFPTRTSRGLVAIDSWNDDLGWKRSFGKLAPRIIIFAEDAFGLQFGFDEAGRVAAFWSETAEVEPFGYALDEFLERIVSRPEETISLGLYQRATQSSGPLRLDQHFACKVETALGGLFELDNLVVMDAIDHMAALGRIAVQISG